MPTQANEISPAVSFAFCGGLRGFGSQGETLSMMSILGHQNRPFDRDLISISLKSFLLMFTAARNKSRITE